MGIIEAKFVGKIKIYVDQNQANAPLYTLKHVFPAARIGKKLAPMFSADPLIVDLGLLLHDIGYHRTYESEERDHIVRGVAIARPVLLDAGFSRQTTDAI